MICIKRMALTYRMADSVEYLEGEWAGIGITDGEACVPGKVYLSSTPHLPELLPANVRHPARTAMNISPSGRLIKEGCEITVNSPGSTAKIMDYQIMKEVTVTMNFNNEKNRKT